MPHHLRVVLLLYSLFTTPARFYLPCQIPEHLEAANGNVLIYFRQLLVVLLLPLPLLLCWPASPPSLAIHQVALSNKAFAGTACWGRRRTANNAKYLQGYCFATTLLLHFRSLQPSWAIPIINSSSSLLFPGRGVVFVGGVNLDNVPGEEAAAVG